MKHWTPWLSGAVGLLAGATLTNLMTLPAALPSATEETCETGPVAEAPAPIWLGTTAPSPAHAERAAPQPTTAEPAAAFMATAAEPPNGLTPEQQRTLVRHQYGALIRELALSPEETSRLLDALSEPKADRDAIVAALGSGKAASFEQLRASIPARQELRRLRDQLDDMGEPVSDEQYRALIGLVSARPAKQEPRPDHGESVQDSIELYRDWLSERERGLRENAAKVLTPTQLRTLDENQELREAMRPRLGWSTRVNQLRAGSGG